MQPLRSRSPSRARPAVRRRPRPPRLVSIGDLVLDVVVRGERGVVTGSDTPGSIVFRRGGSAANTCSVFARLGGRGTFVGAVGRDRWGGALVAALRAEGVSVHVVRVRPPTARLAALVGPRGERSFVTQRGAADHLDPGSVRPTWITGADALHIPAYSLLSEPLAAASLRAVAVAREAGVLVSVDVASRGPLLGRGRRAAWATLAGAAADVLFSNLDEATAVTGTAGLRSLLDLAALVVIKEGGEGCRVMSRRGGGGAPSPTGDVLELTVATARVDATDTTGAGDAFDAGFLHSLLDQAGPGHGQWREAIGRPSVLRRAALAGHRAAAQLITRARPELVL